MAWSRVGIILFLAAALYIGYYNDMESHKSNISNSQLESLSLHEINIEGNTATKGNKFAASNIWKDSGAVVNVRSTPVNQMLGNVDQKTWMTFVP